MSLNDTFEGRWVLCADTHHWWRLPDHMGSYATKKYMATVEFPEPIPERRRRLIPHSMAGWLDSTPLGQVQMFFPGDIVAITKDVWNRELELIWWDL